MDVVTVLVSFVVAAIAGLTGGAAIAGALLRRSGPVATAESLAEMTSLRSEWSAWKTGAEAVLENLDELHEVIERKRRRVAARESKEKQADQALPNGNDRAALLARARAMGHPV